MLEVEADVDNLVNSVKKEFTDQDLIEMEEQLNLEKKEDSQKPGEGQKSFMVKKLCQCFHKMEPNKVGIKGNGT